MELEKLFVVVEHELPDREQLGEIAWKKATGESELPEGNELKSGVLKKSGLLELHRGQDDFEEVEIDLKNQQIAVQTERVVLEEFEPWPVRDPASDQRARRAVAVLDHSSR